MKKEEEIGDAETLSPPRGHQKLAERHGSSFPEPFEETWPTGTLI